MCALRTAVALFAGASGGGAFGPPPPGSAPSGLVGPGPDAAMVVRPALLYWICRAVGGSSLRGSLEALSGGDCCWDCLAGVGTVVGWATEASSDPTLFSPSPAFPLVWVGLFGDLPRVKLPLWLSGSGGVEVE
jgi:hypothetical protein